MSRRTRRDIENRPHRRGWPPRGVVPPHGARTDRGFCIRTEGTIRVVIVDDHDLVRQGLEAVFASEAGVAVVGQAANGRSAVEVVAETLPDVILMDLQLPGLSGLEATREILEARPDTAVLWC
jgi:PleD family two-component response regulator